MLFRTNNPHTSYTIDSEYIELAVAQAKKNFTLKRGWKMDVRNTMLDIAGQKHRAAYISVNNSKGTYQTGAVVYSVEPTEPVTHLGFSNCFMHCSKCGSEKFFDLGRSMHSYNMECASCGHTMHPLTETGMSQ